MKFTCAKDTLSEAISICSHAVSAKASTPILEGLLIRVQRGQVTMTGFNYKTGIQRTFAADRTEDGEVVLTARILGDIVRKMPSADITVSVDEKLMANIRCGSSEFNIVAGDAKEFPEMPFVGRENGVNIPVVCEAIINQVRYLVSSYTGVQVANVEVFVDSMTF